MRWNATRQVKQKQMNKTEQFDIYGEFREENASEETQSNAKCPAEKRLQPVRYTTGLRKKVGRFFSDSEKCTLHLHNYSTCGPLKTVRIV